LNCQENGAGDGLEPEWYIAHPSNIPERVMTSPSLKITHINWINISGRAWAQAEEV